MLTEKQQIRHDLIISLIDKKGFKIDSNYAVYLIRYVDELFEYILNGEDKPQVYEKDPDSKKACLEEPLKDEEVPTEPAEDAVEEKINPWAPFDNEADFNSVLAMFNMVYRYSIKINDSVADSHKTVNGPKIDVLDLIHAFPNDVVSNKWIELDDNTKKINKFKKEVIEQERHKEFDKVYRLTDVFSKKYKDNIQNNGILLAASQMPDPLLETYINMYKPKEEVVEDGTTSSESVKETIIPEAIDGGEIRGRSEESLVVDEHSLNIEKSELQNLQCYEVGYVGPYGKPCFETVPVDHFPLEWAKIIRGWTSLNDIDFDYKVTVINNIIKKNQVNENENIFTEWLNDCIKVKAWLPLLIEPHTVEQLLSPKTTQNIVTPTDNTVSQEEIK